MGKHLTDEQVLDIQRRYQRNRHRGSIKDLMDRFEVSRNTITKALMKTVAEKSSVSGVNPQVRGARLDEDCSYCMTGKIDVYCLGCRRRYQVDPTTLREVWYCGRCTP